MRNQDRGRELLQRVKNFFFDSHGLVVEPVVRVSVYEVGFEVVVEYGVRGTRREVGSNITRATT